jgi:hypothetical protein
VQKVVLLISGIKFVPASATHAAQDNRRCISVPISPSTAFWAHPPFFTFNTKAINTFQRDILSVQASGRPAAAYLLVGGLKVLLEGAATRLLTSAAHCDAFQDHRQCQRLSRTPAAVAQVRGGTLAGLYCHCQHCGSCFCTSPYSCTFHGLIPQSFKQSIT